MEIPANEVVKKNNKNEMSKTFFIFFSIPNDLFFGESNIYQNMWDFSINVGISLGGCLTVKN
jgi:hypothetical protein